MEYKYFKKSLEQCSSDIELARLADEVFEKMHEGMDIGTGKKYISELLGRGLNPAICSFVCPGNSAILFSPFHFRISFKSLYFIMFSFFVFHNIIDAYIIQGQFDF